MAYSFLQDGWEDNVRAACGGVSSGLIPDSLLELDAYAPESEDYIKALITDWEDLDSEYESEFNRAAYYHVASKVCMALKVKMMQSERIGTDYSYAMAKIDWDAKAAELFGRFHYQIGLIKPSVINEMTVIDLVSPESPYYQQLTVEEPV